jgi:hypothetical protein
MQGSFMFPEAVLSFRSDRRPYDVFGGGHLSQYKHSFGWWVDFLMNVVNKTLFKGLLSTL